MAQLSCWRLRRDGSLFAHLAPLARRASSRSLEAMGLIAFIWALQMGVAGVISVPIIVWGAARRVHWYSWELLAFVLPFSIWFATAYFCGQSMDKGISNAFDEPIYIGLAIPIFALIRVLPHEGPQQIKRDWLRLSS